MQQQQETQPTIRVVRSLPRSIVAQQIRNNQYNICRINQVANMTVEDVANEIERLLRLHGDNMVNVVTSRHVIEGRPRYYVFAIEHTTLRRPQILGVIAVDRPTGEIMHLVVDRRYRRLGIARRLLETVLTCVELDRKVSFHTWIRKENAVSLTLFRSFGFEIDGKNHRSYHLTLRR